MAMLPASPRTRRAICSPSPSSTSTPPRAPLSVAVSPRTRTCALPPAILGAYPHDEVSGATQLLDSVERGQAKSAKDLLPLVYEELRRLARTRLEREPPGQTLQATALVHEAYLRLTRDGSPDWNGRGHFFGAAAEAMRRILIEQARRKKRLKHGGEFVKTPLDEVEIACPMPSEEVLLLDEALNRLEGIDPQVAQLVKLRFFAGFTQQEAADALGVSHRTADRSWVYAQAWLYREIQKERGRVDG